MQTTAVKKATNLHGHITKTLQVVLTRGALDAICGAEVLSADLKPHQQQLMTVAAESLVGCDDAVWTVAAPTACAILCSMGESICVCSLCCMMLSSRVALPIEASVYKCPTLVSLFDGQLWSRLVLPKPFKLLCVCKHELQSSGHAL